MAYQLWILDADYRRVALLESWLRLSYRVSLNQACAASLDLAATDPKISACDLGRRLHIVRDGVLVWGGLLGIESWSIEETAPEGDIWGLDALSYEQYLAWRTIPRPAGEDFYRGTGPADDVAKDCVYDNCGAGADAARQFPDLRVQADAGECASVTKLWVGGTVLEHLQRLGAEQAFWWRVVPLAQGCEFRTGYPLWGADRTRGNGVNDELVFSVDRRTAQALAYKRDVTEHCNYVYVGGAGEDKDQLMAEVEDADAVAAWGRRELWLPATNYTTVAGLEAEGTRGLGEHAVAESMTVTPAPGSVTPANLGDRCTAFERRRGRTYRMDAVIRSIDVAVGKDGVEICTPELIG